MIHIPDESAKRAAETFWQIKNPSPAMLDLARAAIAAGLAAWPGKRHDKFTGQVREFLILPLKEISDE